MLVVTMVWPAMILWHLSLVELYSLGKHETFESCDAGGKPSSKTLTTIVTCMSSEFSRTRFTLQLETIIRNTLVTPTPHIQGKNMNKHLDKIWPLMLQNKAKSTLGGPYFSSYFCLVCGVGVSKRFPRSPILREKSMLYNSFKFSAYTLWINLSSDFEYL